MLNLKDTSPSIDVPLAAELQVSIVIPVYNEEDTLPAIETLDEGGHWRMRVVPNLFPAFDGEEPFAVHHLGPVHVEAEASGIQLYESREGRYWPLFGVACAGERGRD